jgi:VanZ like family
VTADVDQQPLVNRNRHAPASGNSPAFTENRALLFVLLWAGLIFGTSCTVITTDELFGLARLVSGRELAERFEIFWGIAWFTVVKGWHAAEFAILTAGLIALLNAWRPMPRRRNILLGGGLAILFAASDEFHQTFVPMRDGNVWDVLIDSLGIGLVMLYCLSRLRRPVIQKVQPANVIDPGEPRLD